MDNGKFYFAVWIIMAFALGIWAVHIKIEEGKVEIGGDTYTCEKQKRPATND